MLELQEYFLQTIKNQYQTRLKLFQYMKYLDQNLATIQTLENFIARFHEREVIHGQMREILYDIIYEIDTNYDSEDESAVVYKIVHANTVNSHRTSRSRTASDWIVHCRCGSVYDESSLVQCYACQVRFPKTLFNSSIIFHLFLFSYGNMLLVYL